MKRLFGLFIGVLALVFLASLYYGYRIIYTPFSVPEAQVIEVRKGMTTAALVEILQEKKLITSPRVVKRYIQIMGLAKNFKAGIYSISAEDSLKTFFQKVISAQVLRKTFTIVDGTTMTRLLAQLEKAPFILHPEKAFSELNHTGFPGIEGLVLADTYYYNAGTEAYKIIEVAHKNLLGFLNQVWKERSPNLPYQSTYELLIVASILEKETADPTERKLISGVIVNRLRKGMPLQMDPTVIYALQAKYTGKISHADLLVDSPYNTYKYRGLPPTPIAIVGKEALLAAAHPLPSTYLYFVAKGDGTHIFSTNYEEQRTAVERYRDRARDNHGSD